MHYPTFMVQWGIASTLPRKQTNEIRTNIPDDDPAVAGMSNTVGMVSLAKAVGPHTRTAPLFINIPQIMHFSTVKDMYTLFATVMQGREVFVSGTYVVSSQSCPRAIDVRKWRQSLDVTTLSHDRDHERSCWKSCWRSSISTPHLVITP